MATTQETEQTRRVLIAGGGTGGHVYPALATIEALQKAGTFEFLYVGGKGGIETRIVPRQGIPMETIWIAGIARRFTLKNLLFPVKLLASLWASRNIIKKFRPDVAIGTGGYVSGPILYMAAKMNIPVLIQEQDAHPGLTTRLLAKYARRICLAFPGMEVHFPAWTEKLVVTGNPVRADLRDISAAAARREWGFTPERPTLFVFGGSQGARSINLAMEKILPDLLEKYHLQVLWQTGESQYAAVCERMGTGSDRLKIVPYVQKMNAAYAAADVVVCRAGAITLAELAIVGKAAILVPYPFAAGQHQAHNSRLVEQTGAAVMITEAPGWENQLRETVEMLIAEPERRQKMSAAWQLLARPNAADEIAAEVLKLLKNKP